MIYVAVDVALYLNGCRIPHRAWWALAALALGGLLFALAYRGAAAQARSYGQQIRTAIDLHRFELLKALHLPLPATPQEERALWARLAAWLYNSDLGTARDLDYDQGKQDQKAEKPEEGAAEFLLRPDRFHISSFSVRNCLRPSQFGSKWHVCKPVRSVRRILAPAPSSGPATASTTVDSHRHAG